ncbi:YfhO family protein [uncultured Enterococcus sp.]|uniref:YfhO family protein n=1 Tax=uncultured Enterococcus sp. TaxID=167972 RepID=UPI003749C36A
MHILIVLLVIGELGLNSTLLIQGIAGEWGYPGRSYYDEGNKEIKQLVQKTKVENSNFYRLENLEAYTGNESFRYQYSGVSMFSSIRNRHSSIYLDALGFRSNGTNLNIRYANNTLLMDSIIGMKYNLWKDQPAKYGFEAVESSGEYTLYENKNALPLGMMTDEKIYEPYAVQSQTALFKHLSETDQAFFDIVSVEKIGSKNVTEKYTQMNKTELVAYTPEDWSKPMEIEWKVEVPAKKQAYFSIYLTDYEKLTGSPQIELEITEPEETSYSFGLIETGQYYNLGYSEEARTIRFKTKYTNLKEDTVITMVKPDIALLDTESYQYAVEQIQEKGVDFEASGRKATAEVTLTSNQVLLTTIPYDKGWKAYVDGEQVDIPLFKEAFLTLPLKKGTHTIEFIFFPQGLMVGIGLFISCIISFFLYTIYLKQSKERLE